jgi:hypothetical protein
MHSLSLSRCQDAYMVVSTPLKFVRTHIKRVGSLSRRRRGPRDLPCALTMWDNGAQMNTEARSQDPSPSDGEFRAPVPKPSFESEVRQGKTRILLGDAAFQLTKVTIEGAERNDAERARLMAFINRHVGVED